MKIAIVTGASSGIGLETAALFSAKGYKVYALSRSITQDEKSGVTAVRCDVTDEDAVKATFSKIFSDEGRIDVLVNNAGFGISGAVEFTELESAKKQFDVNFFGCFICSKSVAEYMRKSGGGKIINISSMAAPLAIPFQAFYSASKAAVNSLTLALANELKPFNIKVCAIMPGDVKTSFTASRQKVVSGAEIYGKTIEKSVKTMEKDEENGMKPSDIARAVYSLSQKKSPKPLSTVGASYKLLAVVSKLLPERIVNSIVGSLYT